MNDKLPDTCKDCTEYGSEICKECQQEILEEQLHTAEKGKPYDKET